MDNLVIDYDEYDYLVHYGTLTFSGRYRWGSGDDPYQRLRNFMGTTKAMQEEGHSEQDIAKALGFTSTTQLRDMKTIARYDQSYLDYSKAVTLREKGYSHQKIAEELGWGSNKESRVRKLLAPNYLAKQQRFENSLTALREQVKQKELVDVGAGVQEALGLTATEKNKLVRALEMEGYEKHIVKERSGIPGQNPSTVVLAKPGTTWSEAFKNRDKIQTFSGDYDVIADGNPLGVVKPKQLAKNRVQVVYGNEGGAEADGLIKVRPGVKDLSMGDNHYAQVRIQVGPKHYMKGMAVYANDLPDGVDVQFFTNKNRDVPVYGDKKASILKPVKVDPNDPNNPFGTSISRQITKGEGKNRKATSALNIVNEEADWKDWSRNLPAQFLVKQNNKLVRSQLEMTQSGRRAELEEIKSLKNNTVKQHMLEKYAESADAAAVHLKAAALTGQRTHVLMPVPTLKDNEVYAPNYPNGTRVSLVRFPHAGRFEIPELVVNNRHKDAEKLLGKPQAAIGINARVAERMSGADFDGDTVLVLPNNSGRVKADPPLAGLKNFDPHIQYQERPGMKLMTKRDTQREMGRVSNLITDMDLQGATPSEMSRAVRHSMVVIDAEKHRLDYKLSEQQNGIAALRKKYQPEGGASTLISRSRSPQRVPEHELRKAGAGGPIAEDGSLVFVPTGRTYTDKKTGKEVEAKTKGTKMEFAKDAHALSSGTPKEQLYADHANIMKGLANEARREMKATPNHKYSPEARKKYAVEVAELDEALRKAKANAPKERLAQRAANARVAAVLAENPSMDRDDIKKYRSRSLESARERVGAKKDRIDLTDKQWEAIQAGAVSHSKLQDILRNGNQEKIVNLATPKQQTTMTSSRIAMIKSLSAQGYTQAEIADRLGISTSTVNEYT